MLKIKHDEAAFRIVNINTATYVVCVRNAEHQAGLRFTWVKVFLSSSESCKSSIKIKRSKIVITPTYRMVDGDDMSGNLVGEISGNIPI